MPTRRGAQSSSSLSPQDSSSSLGFPRSNSPSSSGSFTQLLTKPSKWFQRSASAPKFTSSVGSVVEPRASSSSSRKHKISRPTDPRPILENYGGNAAARSQFDLSSRGAPSLDLPALRPPGTPPAHNASLSSGGGLGDLRSISQRAWSKSADDLSRMSPTSSTPSAPSPSFQEKIAQYRNRSNSNLSLQPFPSSSPPHMSNFPPSPKISVTGDPMEQQGQQQHHVRSHSFTPKQSSKLAPSPKRKTSRENEERLNNVPSRSFPFHLPTPSISMSLSTTPPSPSHTHTHRMTTLLAPPPNILTTKELVEEPEPEPEPTAIAASSMSKRASQIVYHSGFINRFVANSLSHHHHHHHHHHQQQHFNNKGWKPFKAELKGTKLYLFKPPSDRATAVKELFPTELVPEQEEEGVVDESATSTRRDEGSVRKKRAYWGRKTHPSLVLTDGAVEGGTSEALVHEAVFATTFPSSESPSALWMDFASAVLLCLPTIVGQGKFEVEFLRCCDYLISGGAAEEAERMKGRVKWLASEYLRFYDSPADQSAWDEWKKDVLPDVSLILPETSSSGLATSSSTQAIFQPSPNVNGSPSMVGSPQLMGSPNVSTFSPRPDDNAPRLMSSIFDALNISPSSSSKPPPWAAALDQEGLSRDVLLILSPTLIAKSLTVFHRRLLPEKILASSLLSDGKDQLAAFMGSNDHPHWLTKLLLVQILGADTSTGFAASPSRQFTEDSKPTSKTHSRSEVLSAWIKVGEHCRTTGDICSWRAIFKAICSPPVARLEKAWKRVEVGAMGLVGSWIRMDERNNEEKGVAGMTPWGGDLLCAIQDELANAGADGEGAVLKKEPMERVRKRFENFRTDVELCPRQVDKEDIGEDMKKLLEYWKDMQHDGGGGGVATKFQRVDQFMSLSIAAEARKKGLFEPHFWTGQGSSHQQSLIPLLFPEALPTISLVDRSKVIRGRLDSDAPLTIQELRVVDGHLRPEERRSLSHNTEVDGGLSGLASGGTIIPVYNGELLLVVQQNSSSDSAPSSRPSSRVNSRSRPPSSIIDGPGGSNVSSGGEKSSVARTPSIRVKPGSSQGLDRKSSMARRNSLPALSNKRNFIMSGPSSEPPLRVLVKSGTLNQLVTVLAHGLPHFSVSVADDNGEMTLKEGMTRELALDHAEFAGVWWNVFRSFVTPLVLFELLRKLYVMAQPQGPNPFLTEYLKVIQDRSEVLETLKEWLIVGGGAQDMLDDTSLLAAVRSFLDSATDHTIQEMPAFMDPAVQKAWSALNDSGASFRSLFKAHTMRPHVHTHPVISRSLPSIAEARVRNMSTKDPPDIDHVDAEQFVDNLDGMACAAFSNVTEEDLFATSDILEVQTSDRTGWFVSRDTISLEEAVEVQTIYSLIQDVEPSPMISELGQDSLYRLLPPGIRSCIRAFSILRKWLISKIVASRLGLRQRMARMELLLRALEITRVRNTDPAFIAQGRMAEQPCVRSFVETVITSAILSPESRAHQRAWQNVAAARGTHPDSLATMLFRPGGTDFKNSSKEALTVDMGWLIERLLDVISTPDVVTTGPETQGLVNFDKRRHLYSLISKAPSLLASRRHNQQHDINRRGFERLNNIEREVFMIQFDLRGIKEEAQRENLQAPTSGGASARKLVRPFSRSVALQIEKNRRDRHIRTRLQKEKINEQTRNEKRDDMLNKAMRPRPTVAKQHRSKKSMSAFLQFMRPISSAFISEPLHSPGLKRTASELDFAPSGKPAMVVSLMDARVAQFINSERSYTFQLDTEDGGHYLLQALSKKEMTKWIETIERITNLAAKRRLTYIGTSPQPQVADHIHTNQATSARDPVAVFGVDLDFLLQREAGGQQVPPGTVPTVIEQCLSEIEARGLSEVGIYRIAGAVSEINALKDAFNRGESPLASGGATDIHAVCDLVKTWFRVLPEPVFPPSSYHKVIDAIKLENLDDRLKEIRSVVQSLSQANFDLLKRVSEHLDKVTDFEEHNQMTAEALAIVFSPNLLRAPNNDFTMILANMGHAHKLVKALITHFHVIFDEGDPEADGDQDDDLESPIVEEEDIDDEFPVTPESRTTTS